jgi:hypothetical protein
MARRLCRVRGIARGSQQGSAHPALLLMPTNPSTPPPPPADEPLAVFVEGRDEALLHYDGGEFYQWLQDCEAGASRRSARCCVSSARAAAAEAGPDRMRRPCCAPPPPNPPHPAAGRADPADGLPYPLVVQDREMRTLLEVRPPEAAAAEAGGAASPPPLPPPRSGEGIIVPTVRLLPPLEQPDELVREVGPPVVQRAAAEAPDVPGTSAVALAALAAWRSAEAAVAADPPYIRYVQVCSVRCGVIGVAARCWGMPWFGMGVLGKVACQRTEGPALMSPSLPAPPPPPPRAAAHPRRPGPGC